MTGGRPGRADGGGVAGAVLAAGASRRMEGTFKLLLPYGRGTVVEGAVTAALEAGLDPVVVVVGHRAGEVRERLGSRPVRVVENPAPRAGQGTSVAAAVRALGSPPPRALAILLADEPGIRAADIRAVVRAWADSGLPAARARYRDRPGHPVVFGRALLPRLSELGGDDGGRELLRSLGDRVLSVTLDAPAPVDVDTRAAYREAVAREAERD